MVGCGATAMEALAPEGHVLVEGEIWRAAAATAVPKGASLRVLSHDHGVLRVAPDGTPQAP
jgi:membrane-bound serine protease (ClpP class)